MKFIKKKIAGGRADNRWILIIKIAAVVAVVFVLFLEFRKCDGKQKDDVIQQEAVAPAEALSRERAYYASKDFVRKALSQADSIVFPDYDKSAVFVTSQKNIYTVNTQIDEITASGLSTKHEYIAQMEKIEERNWSCRSLLLDGKEMR